jgi:hypothetical protein
MILCWTTNNSNLFQHQLHLDFNHLNHNDTPQQAHLLHLSSRPQIHHQNNLCTCAMDHKPTQRRAPKRVKSSVKEIYVYVRNAFWCMCKHMHQAHARKHVHQNALRTYMAGGLPRHVAMMHIRSVQPGGRFLHCHCWHLGTDDSSHARIVLCSAVVD